MPGLLTEPLRVEYRWSRASVGLAASVNMVAYGLVAPFTAAWMDRFGLRRVALVALPSVAVGGDPDHADVAGLALHPLLGLLVGAGTGSLSMTFAATVAQRWFMERRGLVVGALTGASAFGQVRVACRGPVGTVLRPDRNPHLGAVPKSLRNPLVTQRNHTYSHLTLVQLGPDQHPPEPRATR